MAYAYKPPHSKTWRIRFTDHSLGRVCSISAKTRDKKEARRKAKILTAQHQLKLKVNSFISNPNRSLKLKDALELYSVSRNIKPKTKKAYEIAIDHLITAAGDKPLLKFTKSDNILLQKHLNSLTTKRRGNGKDKPVSINTRANYTRHLFAFFKWLTNQEFISENIISKVKPEIKIVEIISQQDLQEIFERMDKYSDKRNSDLIKLKFYAAFRAQELLNASVEDFDFKNKIVRINNFKGNRVDEIPMVTDLYEHLQKMELPDSGRITNLKYMGLRSAWQRVIDNLGMTYNLHQLRKTRGTSFANAGVSPIFLHKFMRHENIKTTMDYYIRVDMKIMENEINKLLTLNLTPNLDKK
ncbi:MAG: hypothetical protein B6D44_11010 [Ignavibacteriales bacterium UTCHB2]|jgi:integrase|nr:MAG: hypothetical protein B6D44_11010 [Ignavibacteriales bacterium UTCHB2]